MPFSMTQYVAGFALVLWPALAAQAATSPPVNPWLAQGAYPISHHNSAQSDSTPVDGPNVGRRLRTDEVQTVPLLWSSAPTFKVVNGETIVVAANPDAAGLGRRDRPLNAGRRHGNLAPANRENSPSTASEGTHRADHRNRERRSW